MCIGTDTKLCDFTHCLFYFAYPVSQLLSNSEFDIYNLELTDFLKIYLKRNKIL